MLLFLWIPFGDDQDISEYQEEFTPKYNLDTEDDEQVRISIRGRLCAFDNFFCRRNSSNLPVCLSHSTTRTRSPPWWSTSPPPSWWRPAPPTLVTTLSDFLSPPCSLCFSSFKTLDRLFNSAKTKKCKPRLWSKKEREKYFLSILNRSDPITFQCKLIFSEFIPVYTKASFSRFVLLKYSSPKLYFVLI